MNEPNANLVSSSWPHLADRVFGFLGLGYTVTEVRPDRVIITREAEVEGRVTVRERSVLAFTVLARLRDNFEVFVSWDALLTHLRQRGEGCYIWYHAPLDHKPVRVLVKKIYKNGKVRLDPCHKNADAFTADEGHLDRFRVVINH